MAAIAAPADAAKPETQPVKRTAFFYWKAPVAPAWGSAPPRTPEPERYQKLVNADPKTGAFHRTVATKDGVDVAVHPEGLESGHAYTAWLSLFNHPERCTGVSPHLHSPDGDPNGFRCNDSDEFITSGGLADFVAGTKLHEVQHPLNPGLSVLWINGAVADEDGRLSLSGFIPQGDTGRTGGQLVAGSGVLEDPLVAEYQVTIVDHGAFDAELKDEDDGGRGQTESARVCNGRCNDPQASGGGAGFVTGALRMDEFPG